MYLLRYSEIGLKSPAVRSRWENLLMRNLKEALPVCKVKRTRGRIWLTGPVDEGSLKRVFGIVSFSPCEETSLQDLGPFIINNCERTGLS